MIIGEGAAFLVLIVQSTFISCQFLFLNSFLLPVYPKAHKLKETCNWIIVTCKSRHTKTQTHTRTHKHAHTHIHANTCIHTGATVCKG
jgi:hypothetical protein